MVKASVKILVGKRESGRFSGYWAEFEGEVVSSYEDKDVVYTLYRCTAYNWEAYRVHISDETRPKAPVYELLPYAEGEMPGDLLNYHEPYTKEQVVTDHPLFIKALDFLNTRDVDAK